jgi:hypothetical protein
MRCAWSRASRLVSWGNYVAMGTELNSDGNSDHTSSTHTNKQLDITQGPIKPHETKITTH